MNSRNQEILVLNAGSSSIKFALFAPGLSPKRTLTGALDGIGSRESILRVSDARTSQQSSEILNTPDYASATGELLHWFTEQRERLSLAGVGHRVVHGGPKFADPQRVSPALLEELDALGPLAPHHNPRQVLLAKAFIERLPDVPNIVCFDTAFHHDLPRVAQLLPIPRRFERLGARRYGFHGLSYAFLMRELARLEDRGADQGRVILAHLGSGASLAAVRDGKSVDTSMGLTPMGGVPMATRSGDLDPGLLGYLARTAHLNILQLDEVLNQNAGLLGMSEVSSDMRDLLDLEASDNRAAEAIAVFCYQIKKCIGGFAAAMGGVDTLVFTGGIGENAPVVRHRICEGLAFLGIELDDAKNAAGDSLISRPDQSVQVRVIPTNEEQTIAESVCDLLNLKCETENLL